MKQTITLYSFRHNNFGELTPRDDLHLSIGPATSSSSSSEANISAESLESSPKKFKLFTPYDMSSPRRESGEDELKLSSGSESSEFDFEDKEGVSEDDFEVNIEDDEDVEVIKN